jgi:hypothetical protein
VSNTEDIIKLVREKNTLQEELRVVEEPVRLPATLSEPLYIPRRGGWLAEGEIKEKLVERQELL